MNKVKRKRKNAKAGRGSAKNKATSKAAEAPPIKPMVDDLPQKPTVALARIVGSGRMSLRQANQLVWAYVQRNGYQDRARPHMLHVKPVHGKEEPLKAIAGEQPISMFELTEKLRRHLG